ncbi:CRP/FNR family transcriptional activator FtrB [Natronospira proteinivora]|uniref:CRP/FNR family transcriptional activator FtrB n=1 Tax=Natronospira proteinivora TaxID=1807133 RepID=A0ABT1G7B7_9GAMM|nr:cyclic nucleotide-binding domain-containing protein [Natronospira proteinivora]MCP1727187.1 CRP/FNR family transcriptional activator FtrB [Natronospira proteinivora]
METIQDEKLEALKGHRLLGVLSENARQTLLKDSLELEMPSGTTLFRQGESARFLHVVLEGRVALIGSSDHKDETVVEFFREGDVFIMPAVVLEMPYLMSARTVDDSRILLIPATPFREEVESNAALNLAVTHELSRHWRLLIRQVKDLKLRSAPQRLGSYLLSLADTDQQSGVVELPEQRGMLARRLGMTPENLSRAFNRLQDSGVRSRGRQVMLDDIPALREFCAYDELV